VLARSLLVPGWGQLYNGSWLKALLVSSVEGVLIYRIAEDDRALGRLERAVNDARARGDRDGEVDAVEAYNSRLDERTNRSWFLAAAVGYALLDAYVDAHFRGFDAEFGAAAAPGGRVESRLALRWAF
jgi:hypothetical protein